MNLTNSDREITMTIKKLKQKTIKSYTTTQILRHMDRFMSQKAEIFRIDYAYGTMGVYDKADHCYYFFCNLNNREKILEALAMVYED